MLNQYGGWARAFARRLYPEGNLNGTSSGTNCFKAANDGIGTCWVNKGVLTRSSVHNSSAAPTVVLANFRLVHLVWEYPASKIRQELVKKLASFEIYFRKQWPGANLANVTKLFLNLPLFQSEREPHDNFRTAVFANQVIKEVLEPVGWQILEFGEMTLARGRDSTDSHLGSPGPDGMHHYGPDALSMINVVLDVLCGNNA